MAMNPFVVTSAKALLARNQPCQSTNYEISPWINPWGSKLHRFSVLICFVPVAPESDMSLVCLAFTVFRQWWSFFPWESFGEKSALFLSLPTKGKPFASSLPFFGSHMVAAQKSLEHWLQSNMWNQSKKDTLSGPYYSSQWNPICASMEAQTVLLKGFLPQLPKGYIDSSVMTQKGLKQKYALHWLPDLDD